MITIPVRSPNGCALRRGGGLLLIPLALFVGAVAPAPAPSGPKPAPAPADVAFEGSRLGMSRAEWKALPPPGQLSPHTRTTCSDDPDHQGLALTAAERAAGLAVCAYVDAVGKLSLPVVFPFDGKYRLDHLRYGFVDGRLVQITASVTLDGYDALVQDFTQRYGPSVRLERDTVKSEIGDLPRVVQAWSAPQGSIELVDPVLPEDEIGVRLAATPRSPAAPNPVTARR